MINQNQQVNAQEEKNEKKPKNSSGLGSRIIILCLTHGVNHGTTLFFSTVLLVIAADLGMDYTKLGALVTFALLAYGVGQLPAGVVSDIIGRKNAILLSLLVPAAGCVLGGMASSFAILSISFALIGLGGSFYHPSSYAMIADISTEENVGKAFGYHGIGANIGQAITPVLAGFISASFGWRAIFFVWTAVCVVNAIVIFFFMPKGQKIAMSPEDKAKGKQAGWKQLLSSAILIGLFIIAIQGFVNDGIFAYLPSLLQDDFGMAVVASGIITGIQYGGGVFGQLIGGFVSDKFSEVNVIIVGVIGFMVSTCAMLMVRNMTILIIIMFIMGFFLFMLQPPINAIFSKIVPASILGSSFGVVFIFKYGLGALAPALGGVVAQSASLTIFFYMLAGIMGISIILAVILRKHLKDA